MRSEGLCLGLRQVSEHWNQEIADELGRSKSDIARICQTLGCSPVEQSSMIV